MKHHLFPCVAAIGCLLLASCYPVNENPPEKTVAKRPEKSATDAEKQKEQEAAKKKDREKEELAQEKTPEKTDTSTEKPPTESKGQTYPVAIRAPGRENCVLSPYNNKLVSTLDDNNKALPPGTLVQDPSYPVSEKKFFRVP